MRVTSSMLIGNISQYLDKYSNELNQINDNSVSLTKLHRPSDAPYEVSLSMNYDSSIIENKQWLNNMDNGMQWVANTSETLGHAKDVVQQIYTKAVQGANDSLNESNRASLAKQINSQLEEVLRSANTTYLGKYIFNGDATNVPPFLGIRDANGELTSVAQFVRFEGGNPNNPVYVEFKNTTGAAINDANALDGVYYDKSGAVIQTVIDDPSSGKKSIDGEINRRTEKENYINIATNGGDAFQPNGSNGNEDIFKTIIKLRDGFRANNSDQIGSQIKYLNSGMDRITSSQASSGIVYNRLDLAKDNMTSDDVSLTKALSNIKDTDLATSMMEYTRVQSVYNMALQISMKISQSSLINYM